MHRSVVIALLVLGLVARTAFADTVDDLASRLRGDPDYKVRLSAAINLGKFGDRRAIPALLDGLGDTDRAVRGVSAAALGALVDASVSRELRARVIHDLDRLAGADPDGNVRAQAQRSLAAVRALQVAPPPRGHIFVQVGPLSDPTHNGGASLIATMRRIISETLGHSASGIQTEWPGGEPDEGALRSAGMAGFYVDASLSSLDVVRGTPTRVSCYISIYIATFPQKSMFAFAKGNAEVETGSSEVSVNQAKVDCVRAVLEDLVASQIAPALVAHGGTP